MNILIISNRFFSIANSRQTLINELLLDGARIVIAANFDGFERNIDPRVKCVDFKFTLVRVLQTCFKLQTLIKREKITIVHAFNPIPVFVAGVFKILFSYKLIVTITGLGAAYAHGSNMTRLYDWFYRLSLTKADRVIFQNKDDYNYFINKLPPDQKSKMEVITSSGVDLNRFKQRPSPLKRTQPPFKILFVSRLIKQKGISYLEKIAKGLNKYKEFEIHVYGEYESEHSDSISKQEYENLISLSNVTFHGFVKEIEEVYADYQILICCSLREGVPRVILEASATGLPVVAFNVPGVREGVFDNVNGFLVNPFDTEKFIDRILLLKECRKTYQRISMAGRNVVSERFSHKAIAKRYCEVYQSLS